MYSKKPLSREDIVNVSRSLAQQRLSDEMKTELTNMFAWASLYRQMKKFAHDKSKVAWLVSDLQKEFCSMAQAGCIATERVANRHASIAPEFRDAGIPLYLTYLKDSKNQQPEDVSFYKMKVDRKKDRVILKENYSAFEETELDASLKAEDKGLLLVSGVSVPDCIFATVTSALDRGYEVCLLENMTANSNNVRSLPKPKEEYMKMMAWHGVSVASPTELLQAFKSAAAGRMVEFKRRPLVGFAPRP